jgi:hypothetical protein
MASSLMLEEEIDRPWSTSPSSISGSVLDSPSLGDLLLSLGQGTRRIRDAIDLPFNQHISVLRLRHAHHRGVQGRRTCARQLPWRAMAVS